MSGQPAKRPRVDHSVVNIWERELGQLPNRNFFHRFAASEDLLRRFGLHKKLKKHKGCVNTVSFNADGDILVSGSDDRQVKIWNWDTGTVKLSFDSGHCNNIFQAKFMPFSDDCSIVTSAADGQVRHSKILESGQVEISMLGRHQGQVHKLAIEPGSPVSFYTCGEDGAVKHFDLRTRVATNLFTCKEAKFNLVVYLNAIAVDPRNPGLFAVAGMDEYARVYDIRSYRSEGWYNFAQPVDHFCPRHLIGNDHVGITGLAFSDQSELLVTYSEESIYLFTRDMGLGSNPSSTPSSTEEKKNDARDERRDPQAYKEHKNCETVKGVNFFGPKCEYVVSGSDCGRIFIWRKKDGELLRAMEADRHVVNCVESHPHMPMLCSSGIDTDIKIWTPGGTENAISPGRRAYQPSDFGTHSWFLYGNEEGDTQRWFYVDDDDNDNDDGEEDEDSDEVSDESSGEDSSVKGDYDEVDDGEVDGNGDGHDDDGDGDSYGDSYGDDDVEGRG